MVIVTILFVAIKIVHMLWANIIQLSLHFEATHSARNGGLKMTWDTFKSMVRTQKCAGWFENKNFK